MLDCFFGHPNNRHVAESVSAKGEPCYTALAFSHHSLGRDQNVPVRPILSKMPFCNTGHDNLGIRKVVAAAATAPA
ncbi:hypothetical protein CEXT_479251 [Caerostris extrusa]|uniref:Uncharacterized protein n=1 Tax=Caerostris extrusa TaxID=172846 RepID=A0AAV4U0J1_CAEEX|nr:hypothetical protein CEXT_479251 [Caerostris extrusa]